MVGNARQEKPRMNQRQIQIESSLQLNNLFVLSVVFYYWKIILQAVAQ